jgi:hypothetical protein
LKYGDNSGLKEKSEEVSKLSEADTQRHSGYWLLNSGFLKNEKQGI